MMKLVRIVNSTYNEIDRNLRILENEGIITQQHVGHKRMVSLNIENEKTLVLLKLLKIRDDSINLKRFRIDLKYILENIKENNNCSKH